MAVLRDVEVPSSNTHGYIATVFAAGFGAPPNTILAHKTKARKAAVFFMQGEYQYDIYGALNEPDIESNDGFCASWSTGYGAPEVVCPICAPATEILYTPNVASVPPFYASSTNENTKGPRKFSDEDWRTVAASCAA